MVRKLKFDVRKHSSQKDSGKTRFTASDVKALTQPTSTMVNAETQTDSQWFVDSKEVQTEDCTNATVTIGTQTEPDVVLQAPQNNLTNQEVRAVNDESMKCCEGIVGEKYASVIAKHNGLFKDATSKHRLGTAIVSMR